MTPKVIDGEAMTELAKVMEEQQARLKELANAAKTLGIVLEVRGENTLVSAGSTVSVVNTPTQFPLTPGDGVLLAAMTGQIIERTDAHRVGAVVTVRRIVGDMVEVGDDMRQIHVLAGVCKPKAGDLVLLDMSMQVCLRVVDHPKPVVAEHTVCEWSSVGGQAEAKAALREVTDTPVGLYKAYGRKPPKGILMSGPPGCGKTMLGRAMATALAKLAGRGKPTGFFYVKGPEVLTPWVGASEAKIREIFAAASRHHAEHGTQAVIFIDECDAVMAKRGSGRSSDVDKTIVPTFLTEMDGLGENKAVVVLATNRPDVLDPAVVREGRVDRRVRVTRPGPEDSHEILGIYLATTPLDESEEISDLGARTVQSLWGARPVSKVGKHVVELKHLVSGAMLAGVVENAKAAAMRRDMQAKRTKPSGVGFADMLAALDLAQHEYAGLNHEDVAQEAQ